MTQRTLIRLLIPTAFKTHRQEELNRSFPGKQIPVLKRSCRKAAYCLFVWFILIFENIQKGKRVQPLQAGVSQTRPPQGRSWQNALNRRERGSKKGETLTTKAGKCFISQVANQKKILLLLLCYFNLRSVAGSMLIPGRQKLTGTLL